MAACTICETRKPKRYCTARGEDICTQCCATEREVTINCPFECPYLRESRRHEKRHLDEVSMPYAEVRIDNDFMQRAELVLMLMAAFLNKALQPVPNATDADAREALDAIVVSFRDGKETTPEGEIAAGIVERFRETLSGLIAELKERESGPFTDTAFLGVAVFMARVAHGYDNGRPRGRAYVHYLRETFPEGSA
ncbi:MAG: hypothetical protein HYX27_25450 [Acidobacteria bacterium]|nr:hypothetical protein [Acidobacteriota bacterium]